MTEKSTQFQSKRPKAAIRWKKSEIVGAIVYLFYMRGNSFESASMPRGAMAEMLGVNRHRIGRCIAEARKCMDLALLLNKRLQIYDESPKPKLGRPPASDKREKASEGNDRDFKTRGQRNRNMSLRRMRAGVGSQSQNGA